MGRIQQSQFDKIDDMPSRLSLRREAHNGVKWWRARSADHKVNGQYPYKIARRVVKTNVGRPVNEAFNKFRKLVRQYQQNEFWVFLENEVKHLTVFSRYYKRVQDVSYYFVDDNGLIQYYKSPRKKAPYRVYSQNAIFERRHKITGKLEPKETWWLKGYNRDDYESVLVKGWVRTFESKKDSGYKRIWYEREKYHRKMYKLKMNRFRLTEEELRRILRERVLKEKEKNLVKIVSHGFDPKTSFRKEKNRCN